MSGLLPWFKRLLSERRGITIVQFARCATGTVFTVFHREANQVAAMRASPLETDTRRDGKPDTRTPLLDYKSLSTAYFYKFLTFRGKNYTPACFIWDRIIPHKHRIFLWIALRDRHDTRDNMLSKHWDKIVSHNGCDLCPAAETMSHILL